MPGIGELTRGLVIPAWGDSQQKSIGKLSVSQKTQSIHNRLIQTNSRAMHEFSSSNQEDK
jgi:hypothetical protein